MGCYLKLDQTEEQEFRQWARDNYVPLEPISGVWHPVIQDECAKINSHYQQNDLG